MLNLLRKTRRKLLLRENMMRYFWYALGEITLVMVGILLALQVNNWNEKRKDSKLEKQFLNNLQQDLNTQLSYIEAQISLEEQYVQSTNNLLSGYLESAKFNIDTSFCYDVTFLTSRKTFNMVNPTYTELLSSGKLSLIKDQNLKNRIIEYYQELSRYDNIIKNNNSNITDQNYAPIALRFGCSTDIKLSLYDESLINEALRMRINDNNSFLFSPVSRILAKEENTILLKNAIMLRQNATKAILALSLEMQKRTTDLYDTLAAIND